MLINKCSPFDYYSVASSYYVSDF